jgi:hypothetical protein
VTTRKQTRRDRKRYVHAGPRENPGRDPDERPSKKPAKPAPRGRGRRAPKPVEPASWTRAFRQSAFVLAAYAVLVLVILRPKNQSPQQMLILLAAFALIAVPMTYYMQKLQYRMAEKRGFAAPPKRR